MPKTNQWNEADGEDYEEVSMFEEKYIEVLITIRMDDKEGL
jgi:hypothetical protein